MVRRPLTAAALVVVAGVAVAACGGSRPILGGRVAVLAPPTTQVPFREVALVNDGLKSIAVFDAPGAPAPKLQLTNPNTEGIKRVFLVKQHKGSDWLEVLLPIRPNGTLGWIRSADVNLQEDYFRVQVSLGGHRVTVWNGNDVVDDEPVGVGTAASPTPPGEYFITELLRVPSFQTSAYGPWAFGLSAHSNVYTSFGSGDGTIGLHGTGDPHGLGKDVSHGCIRLSNDGITRLAKMLPLGTPVEITA